MPKIPSIWNAYLLVALSTLFWGGNFVLGRAVAEEIPPVALAWWRWTLALAIISPLAVVGLWRIRVELWAHWRYLLTVSLLSVTIFNTFVYVGLQTLPASNAVIMLSSMPVMILVLARMISGKAMVPRQFLGTLVSIVGVTIIVTEGHPTNVLESLASGSGNVWILLAVLSWALYSVLLQRRPGQISGVSFFGLTVLLGWLMLTPFYLFEHFYQNRVLIWTTDAMLSIGYVGLFASVLAFLFWNRGVQVLGPGRAGHFIHLIPVWGLILAALLLHERLVGFHWFGIALIVTGVAFATLNNPDA